jgi:hypothetical protein
MQTNWETEASLKQAQNILESYRRLVGAPLFPVSGDPAEMAAKLFHAPFVLVAHGTEADPVLNYGNKAALELWEMDWLEFTRTPSRFTAEAPDREERARLLAEVTANGFIRNYSGVRVSQSGRRFRIEQAVVWNVFDGEGERRGQAATFSAWVPL